MKIKIEDIRRNPEQPRKYFDKGKIDELANSISSVGLLQPILVKSIFTDDDLLKFELVDGERRLLAANKLGWEEIEVVLKKADYLPQFLVEGDRAKQSLIEALVANLQREDLSLIEEAAAFKRLKYEFKMTRMKIAELTGKSYPYIDLRLQIAELEEPIQVMLEEKRLVKDKEVIAMLQSLPKNVQLKAAKKLADKGLGVVATTRGLDLIKKHLKSGGEMEEWTQTPMLRSSIRGKGIRDIPESEIRRKWGMMSQMEKSKRVPPWELVVEAANETCNGCPLRRGANESICRECAGVEMITWMISKSIAMSG